MALVLPRHDQTVRFDLCGDVLQLLLPQAKHLKFKLVGYLVVDLLGQADATVRRERLNPRSKIDRIARDVSPGFDHVAQVDAYPELDPALLGKREVELSRRPLNVVGAAHSLEGAGELDEE